MKIVSDISHLPTIPRHSALTIGSFDGLHKGHQFLLNVLKEKGFPVVFTFTNHPLEILKKSDPVCSLCSIEHRLRLLEEAGIQLVILMEFTPSFAEQTYDFFFKNLHAKFSFSHLVLGKGAAFGKGRGGDEEHVRELAKELSFEATYLDKLLYKGAPISSRRVREQIREGNLSEVASFLGRPYSIYGPYSNKNLCLPPPGTYPVSILNDGAKHPALAKIDAHGALHISETTIPLQQHTEIIFED